MGILQSKIHVNGILKYRGYHDMLSMLRIEGTFTRASSAVLWSSTTLTTVGINVARFDTYPLTGAYRGLLIEESRTNLLTYSDDFSTWNQVGVTTTSNAVTSPDGTVNADRIEKDTGTSRRAEVSIPVVTGEDYALSVYVKAGTTSLMSLRADAGVTTSVNFDMSTQLFTVSGSFNDYGYEDVGNGWYRVWVTLTSTLTGGGAFRVYPDPGSTTIDDVYMWRAQMEEGAFITSPILTAGASATRSGDVNETPFTKAYNQNASTFFFKAQTFQSGQSGVIFEGRGVGNSRASVLITAGGDLRVEVDTNNVSQPRAIYTLPNPNNLIKVAITLGQGSLKVYVDGVIVATLAVAPPPLDTFYLGKPSWDGWYWNGWIEKARYYPKILTAGEIGTL